MVKKFDRAFLIMAACYAVSAVVLAFIPILDLLPKAVGNVASIAIGAIFWIGLIGGIVMTVKLSSMRKSVEEKIPAIKSRMQKKFPGVINFDLNKIEHLVVYGIFAVCITLFIVDMIFSCITKYVMFPVITLMYLSFVAHCVIDGKNFKVYRVLKKGSKKTSSEV